MTFNELQENVRTYMYTEDPGMLRIALASIIATRMKIGDPIWMILIGASSSGKSQVLRPLALTDAKFIHRVDDMTEATLLSGTKVKKGEEDISLLKRIGPLGIIVVSDFTVIFSKNSEAKNAILGQFRMVYDGEMTKYSGNSNKPITWKGSIGVLSGSTPSIYRHFEEVADMGERFIYYRMKKYDEEKATRLSMKRTVYGKELDEKLSGFYAEYIKDVVKATNKDDIPEISDAVNERILKIAMFAAQLRTPIDYDKYAKVVTKIPVSEAPMRVALQLTALVKGSMMMHYYDTGSWELGEADINYIEWCAYSLANEEKRACLRILCELPLWDYIQTQTVADKIGLDTSVIRITLQNLGAIGVLERSGDGGSLSWRIANEDVWNIVRRLEGVTESVEVGVERQVSMEEEDEAEMQMQAMFDAMGE